MPFKHVRVPPGSPAYPLSYHLVDDPFLAVYLWCTLRRCENQLDRTPQLRSKSASNCSCRARMLGASHGPNRHWIPSTRGNFDATACQTARALQGLQKTIAPGARYIPNQVPFRFAITGPIALYTRACRQFRQTPKSFDSPTWLPPLESIIYKKFGTRNRLLSRTKRLSN